MAEGIWSGWWVPIPRPSAWKAGAPPLSYTRVEIWWGWKDSNLRTQRELIYSQPPLTTRPHPQNWCRLQASNPRPPAYKADALPTELNRQILGFQKARVGPFENPTSWTKSKIALHSGLDSPVECEGLPFAAHLTHTFSPCFYTGTPPIHLVLRVGRGLVPHSTLFRGPKQKPPDACAFRGSFWEPYRVGFYR